MTCTPSVSSLNTLEDGRGQTYRPSQKHDSLLLLSAGCHFEKLFVCRTPKMKFAVTTQNTTDNNSVMSHTQNTTARQSNVYFNGIHQELIKKAKNILCSAAHTSATFNWGLLDHTLYLALSLSPCIQNMQKKIEFFEVQKFSKLVTSGSSGVRHLRPGLFGLFDSS